MVAIVRDTEGAVPGTGELMEFEHVSAARLDEDYAWWTAGLPRAADLVISRDPLNRQRVSVYDAFGRVIRSIDDAMLSSGQVTDYDYDATGALDRITSVDGTTRSFAHDSYGRLMSVTDASSGSSTYLHNGFDEVRVAIQPDGSTSVVRDALGRVTSVSTPDGLSTWHYDAAPNALGKLIRSVSPTSGRNPLGVTVDYEYEPVVANNRGLLRASTLTVDGRMLRTEVDYDGLGRPSTVEYPSLGAGSPVITRYGYDASSGALRSLEEIGGATPRSLWEIQELYQGTAIQRETFGNGAETTYDVDPYTRLISSIGTTLGGDVVQALEYT